MKKYLIITADTNDGDYVIEKREITDDKLELIKPVIQAIKDFKPYESDKCGFNMKHSHNYPKGDGEFIPREDLGEKSASELYGHLEGFNTFDDYCPYGEYGIHTIDRVELLIIQDEIRLL